ncbi:MAG: hypothetical protein ABIU29_12035 [Chthoniobacterales bacterium]
MEKNFAFASLAGFGRFLGAQKFIFKLPALQHAHQHALAAHLALALAPDAVDQDGNVGPGTRTQRKVNLFRFSVQFQDREKMGVIKNARADREDQGVTKRHMFRS